MKWHFDFHPHVGYLGRSLCTTGVPPAASADLSYAPGEARRRYCRSRPGLVRVSHTQRGTRQRNEGAGEGSSVLCTYLPWQS